MLPQPRRSIGGLQPLPIIDISAYELYRLFPQDYVMVLIPVGLGSFSKDDVERVFAPLESYLDQMMERGVDAVMQNGVPLPLLIGLDAHDRMIAKMQDYTGKPASTTVDSVAKALRHLGMKKVACVNKWSDAMNHTLGQFLAREGVSICGMATKEIAPADFQKIKADDHSRLAYELGKRAFLENPTCDGLYIGGGSWFVANVAQQLEQEFRKPVISNQPAIVWDVMHKLGDWTPSPQHGNLMGSA